MTLVARCERRSSGLMLRVWLCMSFMGMVWPMEAFSSSLIVPPGQLLNVSSPSTYAPVIVQNTSQLGVDEPLTARTLMTIQSGGIVTQALRDASGLVLNVTGTLDVQSGSLIELNSKGLLGGRNGSVFVQRGETFDLSDNIVAGAGGSLQTGAGASFGRSGGFATQGSVTNSTYELLEIPSLEVRGETAPTVTLKSPAIETHYNNYGVDGCVRLDGVRLREAGTYGVIVEGGSVVEVGRFVIGVNQEPWPAIPNLSCDLTGILDLSRSPDTVANSSTIFSTRNLLGQASVAVTIDHGGSITANGTMSGLASLGNPTVLAPQVTNNPEGMSMGVNR